MSNSNLRILKWIIANAIFAGFLWLGLVGEIKGAVNVGLFMAWIAALFSLIFTGPAGKAVLKNMYPPAVPGWVNYLFDISIVLLLVWHSYWLTAVAYFIHLMVLTSAWNEVIAEIKADGKGGAA